MLQEDQKNTICRAFEKGNQSIAEINDFVLNTPSPWRLGICVCGGHLLGDLYTSVEQITRLFVEDVYGKKFNKDGSWHKNLIDAGKAEGIFPLGVDDTLQEMRRFRHHLMHGYGIDMDEDKLREAIPGTIAAYKKIEAHIKEKYPELNAGLREYQSFSALDPKQWGEEVKELNLIPGAKIFSQPNEQIPYTGEILHTDAAGRYCAQKVADKTIVLHDARKFTEGLPQKGAVVKVNYREGKAIVSPIKEKIREQTRGRGSQSQ